MRWNTLTLIRVAAKREAELVLNMLTSNCEGEPLQLLGGPQGVTSTALGYWGAAFIHTYMIRESNELVIKAGIAGTKYGNSVQLLQVP